ncbi:protein zyg-11 homolog [Parasteatoda tepidariorum]|uniref:Protein zyg-11 homolog B-like n=1 Tax=Parasteatoda tepidariorum TaxID=114398 RepID=A0A2L2XZF1_PARTP|nr:protein zyg-11 homolog [Parasteatoda tepidariorum]
MYESPETLQQLCLNFICQNISSVCSTIEDLNANTLKYVFNNPFMCFPPALSQQLFQKFDEQTFTDQLLTIFDSSVTRLSQVYIQNASKLTTKGLRILRSHKISELAVIKLTNVTVNELIGCLDEWTLKNLRILNVSNSSFVNSEKVRVVIALSKLESLRVLDVSNTDFNSQGLEIVADYLKCLESLNISKTKVSDITPLKKCKERLKYLNLYGLGIYNSKSLPVIFKLYELQHLDISEDKDDHLQILEIPMGSATITKAQLCEFIENPNSLPKLQSLDISGNSNIDINSLKIFLSNHLKIKFLGLMENDICQDDMFSRSCNPKLVVTGYATQVQVLESLKRYMQRQSYLQKSLCYLYSDLQNLSEPRLDIIKLVLRGMKSFPDVLGIQMAATACLYNLTKVSTRLHTHWLRKVVECTLSAMENFPNQKQLQKNALLTLCSDRMLQDVTFDRYHCAELVMNSLLTFDDPAMNRMSVAICSILAARISTVETSNLGAKSGYMRRLLDIVRSKAYSGDIDIMMKFTLSALWNLTDESPRTCNVFLELGGLQLFLDVLMRFIGESSVETKVLGLMNNIAEVRDLRKNLMQDDFMLALWSLLQSEHIDVSYFAAGIVAHIASEGESFWTCTSVKYEEMVNGLGNAVLSWNVPATEMVAYRSFNPFYPLFFCFSAHQVQLWAAWAVHHVCLKNPKRYCKMLHEEGGEDILKALVLNPALHESVHNICSDILKIVKQDFLCTKSYENQRESFV